MHSKSALYFLLSLQPWRTLGALSSPPPPVPWQTYVDWGGSGAEKTHWTPHTNKQRTAESQDCPWIWGDSVYHRVQLDYTHKLFWNLIPFDCAFTYTSISFGSWFPGCNRKLFSDQFLGCKGNLSLSLSLSLSLPLSPPSLYSLAHRTPDLGITLTLRRLHLQSYTFKVFLNELPIN